MNMNTTLRRRLGRQLGVSLIEALVALAVMAIGMLGIVGVQATLRANSDVAKQRSEALRLAQREVEKWRSFVVLGSTGATPPGYADMVTATYSESGVSATFNVTRTVTDLPDPRKGKTLKVQVGWTDRTSNAFQQVQLTTMVARIAPEFGATMVVGSDGDALGQMPKGRNRGIPITAKDLGNGTSGFIPPGGAAGVVWVFNNTTGLIRLCSTTQTATSTLDTTNITCSGSNYALLLSGYIHYSLGGGSPPYPAPSATNYDGLPGESGNLEVRAHQTGPVSLAGNVACLVRNYDSVSQIYYCAIPVLQIVGTVPYWSGDLRFDYATPSPSIAPSYSNTNGGLRKICRYHAEASYTNETRSRLNQNYLVIRAGNGAGTSFPCPTTPAPETFPHVPLP
jgi:Tfp pilus assembly protein PilV